MELEFVGTTSGSNGCPTLYVTDRGTIVVQGRTVTDSDALAAMQARGNGIPSDESAVEVPAQLMPFLDPGALTRMPFTDQGRPAFVVNEAAAARIPGSRQ